MDDSWDDLARYRILLRCYARRPTRIKLTAFVKAEVTQICFGAYQLQIHCTSEAGGAASMYIPGQWRLSDAIHEAGVRGAGDSELLNLLGEVVIAAEAKPPKEIAFLLGSGRELVLIDSSEDFESFQLQPGYIVV
jgi:hypothetical protein